MRFYWTKSTIEQPGVSKPRSRTAAKFAKRGKPDLKFSHEKKYESCVGISEAGEKENHFKPKT